MKGHRHAGVLCNPEPGLTKGPPNDRLNVVLAVYRKGEDWNSSASLSPPLWIYTHSEEMLAEVCQAQKQTGQEVPAGWHFHPLKMALRVLRWILRIPRWPSAPLSSHSWVLLAALITALPLIQDRKRMEVCRRLSSCQMKLQEWKAEPGAQHSLPALRLMSMRVEGNTLVASPLSASCLPLCSRPHPLLSVLNGTITNILKYSGYSNGGGRQTTLILSYL